MASVPAAAWRARSRSALPAALAASVAVHAGLLAGVALEGWGDTWSVVRHVPAEVLQVRLQSPVESTAIVALPADAHTGGDMAPADGAVPAVFGGSGTPDADAYWPRALLTRGPQAREAVVVPWPPGLAPAGPQSGRFTLFIDAAGRVQRVVPDGPSLSPPLEEAVRRRFMAVRFTPGELQGRPVRSVVRIEWVFSGGDAPGTALQAPAPVRPAVVQQRAL